MMTNTSTSDDAVDTKSKSQDAPDGKDGSEGGEKGFEKSEQAWNELIESRQKTKNENAKLKAQIESLTEQANASKSQFDDLQSRLNAIESEKRTAKDDADAKAGNIEALRESHRSVVSQKDSEIADLNKKLSDAVAKYADFEKTIQRSALREATLSMLAKVAVDAEDALAPHLFDLEEFELVEDKGKRTLRVKDSVEEPAAYAEKKLKKLGKKHLLLNDRESGSGAQPNNGDPKVSQKTLTKEEIMALPDKGAKYFRENPAAAQAFLGKKS